MLKAIRSVERTFMRQKLKPFLLSNVQQSQVKPTKPVPDRTVAMQHNVKKGVK